MAETVRVRETIHPSSLARGLGVLRMIGLDALRRHAKASHEAVRSDLLRGTQRNISTRDAANVTVHSNL